MGLWGGSNPSIQEAPSVENQEMAIAQKIAAREQTKARIKFIGKEVGSTARSVTGPKERFGLGKSVGQAVVAGQQQQVNFSQEQQMLGEMFGQGEKIWGNVGQPVTINNDLNSSRSDPMDETSSLFGFGDQNERSGLF